MKDKRPAGKSSEYESFVAVTDALLSVPHSEIQKREQEYQRVVAKNPKRRGPKRKVKP